MQIIWNLHFPSELLSSFETNKPASGMSSEIYQFNY